jgi:hypothetical protein
MKKIEIDIDSKNYYKDTKDEKAMLENLKCLSPIQKC